MKLSLRNSCKLASAWLVLWAASAGGQTVTLPSTVSVMDEAVRLSDLLPASASDELRGLSRSINLGRAPRLGSVRVFERARITEILTAHPDIARQLAVPDQVAVRHSGYPLSPEAIHQAVAGFLGEKAIEGSPDLNLQWSHDLTTAVANPELQVRAVNWDPGHDRLQFCLRCVRAAACRDFLVYFRKPEKVLDGWPKLGWSTSGMTKPHAPAGETDGGPILIEAGRKARLLMQGDGIHISVEVICLQNGRLGEKIRVRETGSPRIFRAEVVSRGLLWSRLES